MNLNQFRNEIPQLITISEDGRVVISEGRLKKLVQTQRLLAEQFLEEEIATNVFQTLPKFQRAACTAITLCDEFSSDATWNRIRCDMLDKNIQVHTFIANLLVCSTSNYWIYPEERRAAKYWWLTHDRSHGYCDRCKKARQLERGKGFLFEPSSTLALPKNIPTNVIILPQGRELLCQSCFIARGGNLPRRALPHERPHSQLGKERLHKIFSGPVPDIDLEGILLDLDKNNISLPEIADLVQRSRPLSSLSTVTKKSTWHQRLTGMFVGTSKRPLGKPTNLENWCAFHDALTTAASGVYEMAAISPPISLNRARALLILLQLCPDELLALQCYGHLGAFFWKQEKYFEQKLCFEKQYTIYQTVSVEKSIPQELRLFTTERLAQILAEQGDHQEALSLVFECIAITQTCSESDTVNRLLVKAAEIFKQLRMYERSNDCEITAGHTVDVTDECNSAIKLREEGHFEESIKILMDLLEFTKELRSNMSQSLLRSELAFSYGTMGNKRAAIRELKLAIEGAETTVKVDQIGLPHWKATLAAWQSDGSQLAEAGADLTGNDVPLITQLILASIKMQSAEPSVRIEAELLLREIIAASGRNPSEHNNRVRLASMQNLGALLADTGRPEEGILLFQDVLRLALESGNKQVTIKARVAIGIYYHNLGDGPQCMTQAREALADLMELLACSDDTDSHQQILADNGAVRDLLLISIDVRDKPLAPFACAEMFRARNMARWLELERWLEDAFESRGDIFLSLSEIRREIRAIEVELEEGHYTGESKAYRVEELVSLRSKTRERLDQYTKSKDRTSFKWKDTYGATSKAVESVTDRLAKIANTTVVSLACVKLYVVVTVAKVGHGGMSANSWFQHFPASARTGLIRGHSYAAAWSTTRDITSRALSKVAEDEESGPSFGRAQGQLLQLFDRVAKLVTDVGNSRLVIIADGELTLVPYWPLLDRCPSVTEISVAPSVDAFLQCNERVRPDHGATAVVGDVTSSLGFVTAEVDYVRQSRSTNAFFADYGSYEELKEAFSLCSLVHIAAHGVFWPKNPYESGFPVPVSNSGYSHFGRFTKWPEFEPQKWPVHNSFRILTVGAIMAELKLDRCRVAVLSTCESGIPLRHDGGELLGLPNALLTAGAKSVIASLWKVDDRAAYLMMRFFYDNWVGGRGTETSVAKSLMCARSRLRELGRAEARTLLAGGSVRDLDGEFPFRHSIYTDAFQCFGCW